MKYVGNISSRGRVVAKGYTVHIRGGGKRWSGEIELARSSAIMTGSYDLTLSDGRKGKIAVGAVDEECAYFDGDGELK